MAQAQDIYNPETWTEQDRRFLDAARKLSPEEMQFMIDFLQIMDADPLKSEARAEAAEQLAGQYKLRTAEGRESFLEALRAV